MARAIAACFLATGIFALSLFPQIAAAQQPSAPFGERSVALQPPFGEKVELALKHFRRDGLERLSADELARMQSVERDDDALDDPFLSLDIFGSLAAYDRDLPFAAESQIDEILTNTSPGSRTASEAALLGALEFYAHTPLGRNDVEAGLARLNEISSSSIASSVQSEIHFWKAEGYRALDEFAQAETEYRDAIGKSRDPRLTALAYFRIGELLEREQRYTEADTNAAGSFAHCGKSTPATCLAASWRGAKSRKAFRSRARDYG